MAINDDVKRQAMSAVANVRGQIAQVEATGSTTQMPIDQPKLDPDIASLDVGRVPDWKDTKAMETMQAEKRDAQRDISAPGE